MLLELSKNLDNCVLFESDADGQTGKVYVFESNPMAVKFYLTKSYSAKRLTLRKQHKIYRQVRENNRKLRLDAKKNPKKNPAKNFHIPNAWPLKNQMLDEIENGAQDMKDSELKFIDPTVKNKNLFEFPNGFSMSCIINYSDMIVFVLDARDPMASRCKAIENRIQIMHPEKKIIFLLNKAHLVPERQLTLWLTVLSKEFDTVAWHHANSSIGNSTCDSDIERLTTIITSTANVAPKVALMGFDCSACYSVISDILNNNNIIIQSHITLNSRFQSKVLSCGFSLLNIPGRIFADFENCVPRVLMNQFQISELKETHQATSRLLLDVGREIIRLCTVQKLANIYKFSLVDSSMSEDQFIHAMVQKGSKSCNSADCNRFLKNFLNDFVKGKILHYVSSLPLENDGKNYSKDCDLKSLNFINAILVQPLPEPVLHSLYTTWAIPQ